MQHYRLPDPLHGQWIWVTDRRGFPQEHVAFRREFTLFETPGSAELRITARTLYHVFVNGRYVGFGPHPAAGREADVASYDVGFLLETGKNVISVLVHNTCVSRLAYPRHPGGLWLQLDLDETPCVWTDGSWRCLPMACYGSHMPRVHESSAFCERIDFRDCPTGWTDVEFDDSGWGEPDRAVPADDANGPLRTGPRSGGNVTFIACERPDGRGRILRKLAVTAVEWEHILKKQEGGVFAAECFVCLQEELSAEAELFTDDPYVLFVNGAKVRSQGVPPLPPRADLKTIAPRCFGQSETIEPKGEFTLRRGWNRLLLVQQVAIGSAGFTLLLHNGSPADIHFVRKENDRQQGWTITGPLRTPLALMTGNLHLAGLNRIGHTAALLPCADESAFLQACEFRREPIAPEESELPVSLAAEEYAVFDLGRIVYGCPEIVLKGSEGDIVDVVCGEHFVDGRVPARAGGHRNTDTLIANGRPCRWTGVLPRGVRYIMVVARQAADAVQLNRIGVRIREFEADNPGAFESADPVLNRIWDTGRDTLSATMQGRFMDSPTKDRTQYVTDAAIQAWAAYHVYGTFELGGLALEEFATVQLETGCMPAMCPGDLFVEVPDFALMWPVWLRLHYLYTGDRAFLERNIPALERLLGYFASVALPGRSLLGNLDVLYGAYCFLDHGDIDRKGIVTGLNAIYCRSLLAASWVFEQLGRTHRAEELRHGASRVARILRDLTWDAERGLFADGWYDGEMSDLYSWQTNVLALYGGVALEDQYEPVFSALFSDREPYERFAPGAPTNNPFFKYFILETAFALGKRLWACNLIRHYWGAMLEAGATTWWELFDPVTGDDGDISSSRCHGYGTAPNAYLHREVLGIRPAAPGFTRVFFSPVPGITEWARGHIPTPYGHIDVEWHHRPGAPLEATIQANYPLEVVPVLDAAVAERAIMHVNDEVAILASR